MRKKSITKAKVSLYFETFAFHNVLFYYYFFVMIWNSAHIIYYDLRFTFESVCFKNYNLVVFFEDCTGDIKCLKRASFPVSSEVKAVYAYKSFFEIVKMDKTRIIVFCPKKSSEK